MFKYVRDKARARDYDGVVHVIGPGNSHYACASVPGRDCAMHGVWLHEPTTCLWCFLGRRW